MEYAYEVAQWSMFLVVWYLQRVRNQWVLRQLTLHRRALETVCNIKNAAGQTNQPEWEWQE